MRWTTPLIGLLAHLELSGQWQILIPQVQLSGIESWGAYPGSTLMTGPGKGFKSYSWYMSPSSGRTYRYYSTSDDWQTPGSYTGVGGGGGMGCCSGYDLEVFSPNTLFYLHLNQGSGQVRAVSLNGTAHRLRNFQFYRHQGLVISPTSDSTFIALRQEGYVTRVHRVSTSGSLRLYQLEDILGVPVAVDANGPSIVSLIQDGDSVNLCVTIDEGENWSVSRMGDHLQCVGWGDASTLYAGGLGGTMLRSDDHGLTWSTLVLPVELDIHAMDVVAPDSLWIAGGDGKVFVTGNGGFDWTAFPTYDTTIVRIQAFPGEVYAYSITGRVFKARFVPKEVPQDMRVVNSDVGFIVLGAGAGMEDLGIFDIMGRQIGVEMHDNVIDMQVQPPGIYLIRCRRSDQQVNAKVLWPGLP